MFLRVAVLGFLFLARIQLPMNDRVSSVFQKIYSGEVLKAYRKFQKVDYQVTKAKLDIRYLF